ncbi:ParB/RepB/Spo0J family partition protein [Magnetospira sp. QH-2]|uniref:ParB/RepB/Spo0J family partition protein n=1 Tax=Magnetospira sp. (strain QH-2) TaxID=1288970 RepID=UPI0005FA2B5E|nr:ParB/RepB/Spo0J family partition protein [Magnetospira sp. QH-2]
MAKKPSNLGRGLSALLGDGSETYDAASAESAANERGAKIVPIEFLKPSRFQPRHRIDEEGIQDLVRSVQAKGVLQPLLVRRDPEQPSNFEIIAGERRWRASQLAQLHEVPVIVRDMNDQEALEIALVENLQRQDLSPLEEAEGYRRLMDEFDHTQDALAQAMGKSRSHVANMMRLLGLPDPVKAMVEDRSLSPGHARALLNADDPVSLARKVSAKGLNVRQTERLVKKGRKGSNGKPRTVAGLEKDADTLALERDLSNLLGLRVDVKFGGRGGTLTLHYGTLEQLDDILHRLSHGSAPDSVQSLSA